MKIFEVDTENNSERAKHIQSLIWQECKPYLNKINFNTFNYLLYRGDRKCSSFSKQVTRRNRQPKDTPLSCHELIDTYFFKKFGFRYRSAAVFVTGSESEAREYGVPYNMFPIGEFSFCWSNRCSDLFKFLDEGILRQVEVILLYQDDPDKAYKIIEEALDSLNYVENNDFEWAVTSGNEIMINCSEFYMVDPNEFQIDWS